jgi:chemotaxis protein CheC
MSSLDAEQLDAIKEMVNIGVGRAAAILSQMTGERVLLNVPVVELVPRSDLETHLAMVSAEALAGVELGFRGPFAGTVALVFPPQSASNLVKTLTGDDADDLDLDSVRIGTLTEVGNIVINGVMGSITNIIHEQVKYSVPSFFEGTMGGLVLADDIGNYSAVLLAQIGFSLESLRVTGDMVILFDMGSLDVLRDAILSITSSE